ncbi:MAG: hypothetical protein E7058_04885 [Lentisphaerae bacterium]|nr:hypothetical protein [Lentisphaerota bacterium]
MKNVKRYHFNLIEIMLAIVILALGMTSVFVLFPAGLSNHRTAMAENSIADIAELVISRIRAESALSVTKDGFSTDVADRFPERSELFDGDKLKEPENLDWEEGLTGSDPWILKEVEGKKGLFMARHISGPAGNRFVDFSAVAAVYKDGGLDNELFIPMKWDSQMHFGDVEKDGTGSNTGQIKELDTGKFVLPLVMEISYPAELPYDEREKAYFRFEIFNERFELKN